MNNLTAGIDITPNLEAASAFSSVEAFATISFPSYSFAIFSSVGPSIMHGPHHEAQKSTRTGVVFDFSITSELKFASVTLISIGSFFLGKRNSLEVEKQTSETSFRFNFHSLLNWLFFIKVWER